MISKYILGDEMADAYAAGGAMTSDFIASKPDVAKRFAEAWAEAITFIRANPDEARKYLAHNTLTPEDVVDLVPMLGYTMTRDMTPKQIGELQRFVDFGTEIGVVPEKVDVTTFIKAF